jgi:hypothetical protein
MKKITEGMGSVNVDETIDISRIQKLAGIQNAATSAGVSVAEAMGASEEQRLSALLNNIEVSVERIRANYKQYVELYARTEALMDEEEQMHFSYGMQAMLDLVDELREEMIKHS